MAALDVKDTLGAPTPDNKSVDGSTLARSTDPSIVDKMETPSPERKETAAPAAAPTEPSLQEEKAAESEQTIPVKEEPNESQEEDDYEYPKKWKLGLITMALCLSVFCMALDNTIIATAIPRITDQFKALDDVGWYGSAYLLTICAFQLMFGKLYTFYSIKWVYLIALGIFEVGSLVCGAAPTSEALIVGRAVAGLGSAGIFSGAILIVAHTVPLQQRPTYTGLIGAMYGIASVAGPLMGGAFTDRLTWRWCFYINLPFGAVTALFIIFFFTSPRRGPKADKIPLKEQIKYFDLTGTFFFIPAVVCLLLALQWGGTQYHWQNARIIALLCLFGVLMSCFIFIQVRKGEQATVPPRVFKNRTVWASSLFGAALGAAFFVFCFYLPIWFQAIKGVSAVKSGIMNLPMILGLVITSIITGVTVTMIGYYTPFMIASSIFMSVGAGILTMFTVDTGHAKWIGYQVVFGLGVGSGMQQTLIAVQAALPLEDVPIGTAIMMFAQTLGGALFISVAQNVFSNQLLKNLIKFVPDVDSTIILRTGATELKTAIQAINAEALPRVLIAYNKALTQTWYVAVAMSVLSIIGAVVVPWGSVKGKKIEMAAA